MNKIIGMILAMSITPVLADELTLNDLPQILYNLRGCTKTTSVFSSSENCKISKDDLWVALKGDSSLTIFKHKSYGDTLYANGKNVSELLKNFANKINQDQVVNKDLLNALAPYLPTQ